MKKPLIIFGSGKISEVIHYYATAVCGYNVVGFCVDAEYRRQDYFLGIPLIDFENVEKVYDPEKYDMFIAMGYHSLNGVRKQKYELAKLKGFKLVSIISPETYLPSNIHYGDNCFIMPPANIHPFVKLGNNVFVWGGAMIGHHSIIKDHCWLTSACNIGGNTTIGERSFLAMGTTVGHGIEIGDACFFGANTLVTRNLEKEKVVIADSSKPIKLNSNQFLRFSSFSSL